MAGIETVAVRGTFNHSAMDAPPSNDKEDDEFYLCFKVKKRLTFFDLFLGIFVIYTRIFYRITDICINTTDPLAIKGF